MNCMTHTDTPATAYCRTCGKALCDACQRTALGTVYCAEHVPAGVMVQSATPAETPPPKEAAVNAAPKETAPKAPPPPRATPVSSGPARPAAPPTSNSDPSPWTRAATAESPYTVPHASLHTHTPVDPSVSPGLAFLLGFIPGVGAIYNSQYVKGLVHVIVLGILISIVGSDASMDFHPLFGLLIAVWWVYMAFEAYHTAKKRQMGHPVDEFSSIVPLHRRQGFPAGPVILIAFGVVFLLNTMNLLPFERIIRYWPVLLIVLGAYMLYERIAGSPGRGGRS